jgi:hypothetical protein
MARFAEVQDYLKRFSGGLAEPLSEAELAEMRFNMSSVTVNKDQQRILINLVAKMFPITTGENMALQRLSGERLKQARKDMLRRRVLLALRDIPALRAYVAEYKKKVISDRGRLVPPHGSGPGGPAWQPPQGG